jgi:two-component system, OmpR family, sensor histidine kinase VicK
MVSRSESEIFDRDPDPALDELTQLSAVLCNADFAYIAWIDSNRLCFKSQVGFKEPEQQRSLIVCQTLLENGEPLLIRDAGRDQRFPREGIPLTDGKPCRSYAGVPLITGVHQEVVGSLAVLSHKADRFSHEHMVLLEIMGRQVITRLELYGRLASLKQAQSARQRAERALTNERFFVAAALDSIPFIAALLDPTGCMLRLNYPCLQLTGLTLSDAVGGQFIDQVLVPNDRDWASAILREAADGKVSGPHETVWQTRSGKSRRVSWTLRPVPGSDGVQYLIVSGQDVTEQRETEIALLSSETRYEQMVENSLGFLFTCTMDGQLTSLNAYTAETLGYRIEELTGRPLASFLDADGEAALQEALKAIEGGKEWQGQLRVRRSDGVFRRIAFRSRRMELPDERPFVINHGMDVTEQHEAEEALHLATHQRELILKSVADGIYGIDLEGRLTFVNEAAARILGYPPDELTGCDVHETIHHTHADGTPYAKSESPILLGMRGREAVRVRDEVFWRHDGVPISVEYSASPIIEDGQISGMVVAFQDVSQRRRLELMKDEFASTVSHELRTPLTSMRASLGLIASGALDKLPEKKNKMLEMAIGNCDRLVRLVNDILDFDSGKKGKLPMRRISVEAFDLLRRAVGKSQAAASEAHISFRIDASPAPVMADEDRILQVLHELLGNALKFSLPETTVRLVARPYGESEVCFRIEDQGCGIAPEKLEHIFDGFQQGDASDSRAMGGTGLGLALCRNIVEQHGGRIWAESTLGKGSRILFTLPAAQKL